jgi:DNA repair photolyase
LVAPVIPGLNDKDIPRILEQASEAGATRAGYVALRLPGHVEDVFVARIREAMPLRAKRILNMLRDIRGGKLSDARFRHRMRGSGPYWESIRSLFELSKKRFGFESEGMRYDVPSNAAAAEAASRPALDASSQRVQLTFEF